MVLDHLGNKYKSKSEMAKAYGLTSSLLVSRLYAGWDLEKALTTPTLNVQDHLGNDYRSASARAKAYGLDKKTVQYRLDAGWDLEKALTTPTTKNTNIEDHLGNEYSSILAMAKAYDMSDQSLRSRLKAGWDVEKALTTPVEEHQLPIDHLGNEYSSAIAMTKAYGLPYTVFKARRRIGWDLEKALTTPIIYPDKILDIIYGDMVTIREIAIRYTKDLNILRSRHHEHWQFLQLIDISPHIFDKWNGYKSRINWNYGLTVDKRINKNVYECSIDGKFKIMSQDMIDQYCLEKYKEDHGIKD